MDLNSLARTLAEQAQQNLDVAEAGGNLELTILEAVIREAIEKTIEEAIAVCDKHFKECRDRPNCHLFDADVIRSLKQSNAVAEDEGPCAACGQPKSDSAMHLDSPGKGWGAALHWFKQSNSGMEVRK